MSEPAGTSLTAWFWALLADSPRLVGLGFSALLALAVVPKVGPPLTKLWRAVKGMKTNGLDEHSPQPSRIDSGPTELPAFMTRDEGEQIEQQARKRGHEIANIAQAAVGRADVAVSKVDGIERRVDRHSRILTEVQTEFAEHRGETRARLDAVREKQEESCERLGRVEQQQADSGALLKAVAHKLGVGTSE